MFKLKDLVPIIAAVVIMAGACVLQGMWSERWATFPELEVFAQQLKAIPLDVGDWKGEDSQGSDERTLKIAGAEGEFVRMYKNPAGQQVRVSIICARLQDIFAHTPEKCYPAAGFEVLGEPQAEVFDFGDHKAAFRTTTFQKSEPSGTHVERGYWSWSANGEWIAPTSPRLEFAGQKALYKLYVFAAVPPGKAPKEQQFYQDFIRTFVPELNKHLQPAFDAVQGSQEAAKVAAAAPKS